MNSPEPMTVMEQWVRSVPGKFPVHLTLLLGFLARTEAEAIPALVAWIHEPRSSTGLQAAELTLRGFIDFECKLATNKGHQDIIHANLMKDVDDTYLPIKTRVAINEILRSRVRLRKFARETLKGWLAVRPSDQSIYEWSMERFAKETAWLRRPPNPEH